jgi:uncharacterized integral membrane protein
MVFFLIVLALMALVFVVLFSVQNASPVTIWFFNWRFDASLAIVVFLSMLSGIVIAALFSIALRVRRSYRGRRRDGERKQAEGASPESAAPHEI